MPDIILTRSPVALKLRHPHPLHADLHVSPGEHRDLPRAPELGGVPQHHLGLAMAISAHPTQQGAGGGETTEHNIAHKLKLYRMAT